MLHGDGGSTFLWNSGSTQVLQPRIPRLTYYSLDAMLIIHTTGVVTKLFFFFFAGHLKTAMCLCGPFNGSSTFCVIIICHTTDAKYKNKEAGVKLIYKYLGTTVPLVYDFY